jgi:hypothetical protein
LGRRRRQQQQQQQAEDIPLGRSILEEEKDDKKNEQIKNKQSFGTKEQSSAA